MRAPRFSTDDPIKSLQKQAFIGGATRFIRPLISNIAGKIGPSALRDKITPYAAKAEEQIARGVGGLLGGDAQRTTGKVIKGTLGEMGHQAAMSAGTMGLLQGGLGAAFADENKGQAFLSELGSGALSGAGYGVLGGLVGKPIRNIRQSAIEQTGHRRNISGLTAQKSMDQGFFKNLGQIATGKGPSASAATNRQLAGVNAAGQLGQFGAEMYYPSKWMGDFDDTPQQPQQPPHAVYPRYPTKAAAAIEDKEPGLPNAIKGSLMGTGIGGLSTGLGIDYLKDKPFYPKQPAGKYISRVVPTLGSIGGAYMGHTLGKRYDPVPDENIEEKLDQIDFNKLMRYYKKRDNSAGNE